VSKFNGRNLINIREYFEKDGEVLPGKKVIFTMFSLSFLISI